MRKVDLSVIMPFCREYPQNIFTIQNIAEELRDRVDFEIVVIDNFCPEVMKQGPNRTEDRATKMLRGMSRDLPWLTYLSYTDKLSHWNAKNLGVKHAKGEFLWFCDAHCMVSRDALFNMFYLWQAHRENKRASLHLPLTYHILENKRLIYGLKANPSKGILHYTFKGYKPVQGLLEVPCMSTCGMMMHREMFDALGGWPKMLGIYAGGENFINFTMAILGMKKYIMPGLPLHHHGEKRGYNWNHTDYTRNRLIANFMFGGSQWVDRYISQSVRGSKRGFYKIAEKIYDECAEHREWIKAAQEMTIEAWIDRWV